MASPEVTTVIPVYNGAKFIARAIRSVLAQSIPVECLVVDDCSTDRSGDIALAEGARVFRLSTNHGAASAWNIGMNLAQGRYVSWLAADDVFLFKTKSEVQAQQMDRTNADWSYYALCTVEGNNYVARLAWMMRYPNLRKFAVFFDNPINGGSIMLRKSSIETYGGFDATLRNMDADSDLWLRWLSKGAKLEIIDGYGTDYGDHPDRASRQRFKYHKAYTYVRGRYLCRTFL